MTIAVCIACGTRKFGAFVPCPQCSFVPVAPLDRAKSLMLSDHSIPAAELDRMEEWIRSGKEVPYDPLSLAQCLDCISEEEYFWEHFDSDRGALGCLHCGKSFKPERNEVLCPACASKAGEFLAICRQCRSIYESSASYCQRCGSATEPAPHGLSQRSLAASLALAVRYVTTRGGLLEKLNALKEVYQRLSGQERAAADCELENFALYTSIIALRQVVPSVSLSEGVLKNMVELYTKAWELSGVDQHNVKRLIGLCGKRLEEYEEATQRYPDKATFGLAEVAASNCFGIKKDLAATMEMMLVAGYLVKSFEEVLRSKALHV